MEYEHITHSFEPIYNEDSKILILGTLPSVKSRENNFYYGHKQNRFWKLLAKLCEEETPQTVEEKTAMLLRHHIAIWDVIQSCDIKGSSDSSAAADISYKELRLYFHLHRFVESDNDLRFVSNQLVSHS